MNDAAALKFALERTKALKRCYAERAVSALADQVLLGKRMPGPIGLALRAMKQARKEKKQ